MGSSFKSRGRFIACMLYSFAFSHAALAAVAYDHDLSERLSWSSGRSESGWDYDLVLFAEIPPEIDPKTICIDDPRLPPGTIVVRIRVIAEPREVVVEECEGIPWSERSRTNGDCPRDCPL